jgi:hypothetical protein
MRTPSPRYCRLDLAPPLADRFIVGVAPIDYGPGLLLMPFGFHLTMDTLPSGVPTRNSTCLPLSGQRGITPAFGYSAPHSSARGTSTLLINVLPSAQYLSSDNDPLYRFPQWQANLRILDVAEIKTVLTCLGPTHLWSG